MSAMTIFGLLELMFMSGAFACIAAYVAKADGTSTAVAHGIKNGGIKAKTIVSASTFIFGTDI